MKMEKKVQVEAFLKSNLPNTVDKNIANIE
jgi:hypothetical protein